MIEGVRNTAYVDGGYRRMSSNAAYGFVLTTEAAKIEVAERIPAVSNNVSEYMALIAVLELAVHMGLKQLDVYSDSKLIVNQVTQVWVVNDERLFDLWLQAQDLKARVPEFTLTHIHREENTEADALVNTAMDEGKLECVTSL
jgi:ribonuclease HI